ncbi:tail fiber assembly protein [Serratia nevei]|uniref:tail fiber assembly protein n=1 Tax=Serratia nevei TaxID=2703794 RepID=UPI0020A18308|nr:tail fiber assembly protein [Serratia nevei]MCP1107275.1 tail fiber assembly protein [Serratia nevei]
MMNTYQFSAKTGSFYPTGMLEEYRNANTLPDDLVGVDDETYNLYITAPPEGKIRGADDSGFPAWVNAPAPTPEQQVISARIKKSRLADEAETTIAPLARAAKYGDATQEESAKLIAWEKYSVQLSRIKPETAPDIDWPQPPQ